MIALSLPWVLLILAIVIILLIAKKKWFVSVVLLSFTLIVNWWAECIPFRLWTVTEKSDGICLKVMSFNIKGTSEDVIIKAGRLTEIIAKYNPDVLFIAELGKNFKALFDSLMKVNGLVYTTCSNNETNCFYSKIPLYGWSKIEQYGADHIGAYTCKMILGGDTIVLYGCHFASNNYTSGKKYITPDSINSYKDLRKYFNDVRRAYYLRSKESEVVRNNIRRIKSPILLMGDLNDVCGSKAVRNLEDAGLKDAWMNGGFGYGATIHKPFPYRIDHIMYSDKLRLLNIRVIDSEDQSDHDALYTEFEITKNK